MLSDSACEEAAGADLEETVDHALDQLVNELYTAAVAEFLALGDGASQPADPAMVVPEAASANVHDSFNEPTHGTAESADISPTAVVAVAAGTGSVCPSDGAIHGSSASSMPLLPFSDLIVSPPTAEGCNTAVVHSAEAQNAEAQNAEGQAAHGHRSHPHSTDAAQDAGAHTHSAAAYSVNAQDADGQDAWGEGADAHIAQAQPVEAHSTEAIKAEAADAETHSLAGDTAQAHSAEADSTEVQGPDADMAGVCTVQVTVAAAQLVEPDDNAVAADVTPALSPVMHGASSSHNSVGATQQAVTTAAPEDSAPSKSACRFTAH